MGHNNYNSMTYKFIAAKQIVTEIKSYCGPKRGIFHSILTPLKVWKW